MNLQRQQPTSSALGMDQQKRLSASPLLVSDKDLPMKAQNHFRAVNELTGNSREQRKDFLASFPNLFQFLSTRMQLMSMKTLPQAAWPTPYKASCRTAGIVRDLHESGEPPK